mgnify:CR=1 FL=1
MGMTAQAKQKATRDAKHGATRDTKLEVDSQETPTKSDTIASSLK